MRQTLVQHRVRDIRRVNHRLEEQVTWVEDHPGALQNRAWEVKLHFFCTVSVCAGRS